MKNGRIEKITEEKLEEFKRSLSETMFYKVGTMNCVIRYDNAVLITKNVKENFLGNHLLIDVSLELLNRSYFPEEITPLLELIVEHWECYARVRKREGVLFYTLRSDIFFKPSGKIMVESEEVRKIIEYYISRDAAIEKLYNGKCMKKSKVVYKMNK